jgi:histidinol-phosphate aminotransferase
MAGLRVGFALAPENRIKQLEKFGLSLSMISRPSTAAASACLYDDDFVNFSVQKNEETRKLTYQLLEDVGVTDYIPSYTSFIMFPIKMDGNTFLSKMRANGVGVRSWYFNETNWCRVSLGTPDDMRAFAKALKQIG